LMGVNRVREEVGVKGEENVILKRDGSH